MRGRDKRVRMDGSNATRRKSSRRIEVIRLRMDGAFSIDVCGYGITPIGITLRKRHCLAAVPLLFCLVKVGIRILFWNNGY